MKQLSRRYRLMLLGLLATGLLLVLLLNIQEARTIVVQAAPASAQHSPTTSATVVGMLRAPRYTGQNAQAQWELKAEQASQIVSGTLAANQGTAVLNNVMAHWQPLQGTPLELRAPNALFDARAGELTLPEGLTLKGTTPRLTLTLTAPSANANLQSNTLALRGGVSATLQAR